MNILIKRYSGDEIFCFLISKQLSGLSNSKGLFSMEKARSGEDKGSALFKK